MSNARPRLLDSQLFGKFRALKWLRMIMTIQQRRRTPRGLLLSSCFEFRRLWPWLNRIFHISNAFRSLKICPAEFLRDEPRTFWRKLCSMCSEISGPDDGGSLARYLAILFPNPKTADGSLDQDDCMSWVVPSWSSTLMPSSIPFNLYRRLQLRQLRLQLPVPLQLVILYVVSPFLWVWSKLSVFK